MTRTHLLLAMAGLLMTGALVLRHARVEPERPAERPPPPLAAPAPPVKLAPATPLDGLYFPGGGRRLTISQRSFVLEDASKVPRQSIQGAVDVYEDTLLFWSTELIVRCAFTLEQGRLVIRDGRAEPYTRPCHVLFRRADEDQSPSASSWSRDLGQAGLMPFAGTPGLGLWLDDEGHRMRMVVGPAPAHDPISLKDPPDDLLHWNPDASGVVFELLRLNHGMNHGDSDVNAFWVMTGADTALHVWSGGCNETHAHVHSRAFRRATEEEFAAVSRRSDVMIPVVSAPAAGLPAE